MKVTDTLRTATLGENAENYVVAALEDGSVSRIIGTLGATPTDAKKALSLRDVARRADEFDGRYEGREIVVLAVRHDCDANAVPYVSDGALGHGWECGTCGEFLQAG